MGNIYDLGSIVFCFQAMGLLAPIMRCLLHLNLPKLSESSFSLSIEAYLGLCTSESAQRLRLAS